MQKSDYKKPYFFNGSQKKSWLEQDESVPEISCKNCRNKNTNLCLDYKRKRKYFKKKGTPIKKPYCKFWAYNPNGNGIWKTHK